MLWLNGEIHEGSRASFDLADRGLLLADGLFETVLVRGGEPLLLERHLERLEEGARTLSLPCDVTRARAAITTLATRNAPAMQDAVVRLTLTRGSGPRGLRLPASPSPTMFASIAPWSPALAFQPTRLALSGIRRNASSPLSRLKSLSYLDNILALEQAVAAGADDALLLSSNGGVACSSAGNVFVLSGTTLTTPPLTDGVLAGTTRALVLACAAAAGLEAQERPLPLAELKQADAVFLTNSVRLVSPVIAIGEQRFSWPAMPQAQAAMHRLWARMVAVEHRLPPLPPPH